MARQPQGEPPAGEEPQGQQQEQAVEATAEEVPGTELVTASSHGIIRAEQPEEILLKATSIANTLKGLIEAQNLAVNVGGRRKHVEVGGWQALGTLLGALGGEALHAETVWSRPARGADGEVIHHRYTAEVKRYHRKDQGGGLRETVTYEVDGHDWEARVEIRTLSGLVVGTAEALCSRTEETWNQRPDPAVKSMAETRAESRAYRRAVGWIINIAGYNPTPAEEMPEQQQQQEQGPPFGPPTADDKVAKVKEALAYLADIGEGPDPELAERVFAQLEKDAGGYLPNIVGRAAQWLAAAVKQKIEGPLKEAEQAQQQAEQPPAAPDPTAAEEQPAEEPGEEPAEEVVDAEVVKEDEPTE